MFLLTSSDCTARRITYRLYIPHNEACTLHAILWVHGGGFVLGSVTEFQIDGVCRMMALKSGVRILSVEYRKSPEYSLMAGRADVEEILLFARQYFIWIALGGESAGATLALSVALKFPMEINHLLLVYPVLENGVDWKKLETSWILDKAVMTWFVSNHGSTNELENVAEAGIMHDFLKKSDADKLVSRLPRAHIISADLDAFQIGSSKLEDKFRRANVDVVHNRYPNTDHGFFSFGMDQSEAGIENAARLIQDTMCMK